MGWCATEDKASAGFVPAPFAAVRIRVPRDGAGTSMTDHVRLRWQARKPGDA
jgi:hypothetical protein